MIKTMQRIAIDGRVLQTVPYTGISYYLDSILKEWARAKEKIPVHIYFNQQKEWKIPEYISASFEYTKTSYSNIVLALLWKLCGIPKLTSYISEEKIWLPNINFFRPSSKVPYIVSVHDLSFIHFPEFFSLKMRYWHKMINIEKLLSTASSIIADSFATKRDIMSLFDIVSTKIHVIPLGVGKEYFSNDYGCEISGLPKRYITFIGSIEPRKNLMTLVKAFEHVANNDTSLHLVIAGSRGWLSHSFFKAIKTSAYKDRIHYIGYISNDEKIYLLKKALLFVFPSFYEGFGLPVLEAFATGCPVIAGATGSLPEVVNDAGILINPHQTFELIEAIELLLKDTTLRADLIAKGYKRASEYTWEKTAKATYEVLVKAI